MMTLSKPLSSVWSKSALVVIASMSMLFFSIPANAGFLDSIYEVQTTISSIGRTADTIRGSKNAVTELGEEVGFNGLKNQNNQNGMPQVISGAILLGKLQNTKLYSQADKNSNTVAMLSQQDTMIYMGTEQNGYYYVQSDKGEGWVSKPLVAIKY